MNVLIVDDNEDLLEALKLVFEIEGHTTYVDSTGDNIVEKIQQIHPDVVFLDVFLSKKDGRILCKCIKTNNKLRRTPVILVSAHSTVRESAIKAGADDFVAKPFEVETLLRKVNRCFS